MWLLQAGIYLKHKDLMIKISAHFSTKSRLKAHRQISKKRCFEKYCSCFQACQVSAL